MASAAFYIIFIQSEESKFMIFGIGLCWLLFCLPPQVGDLWARPQQGSCGPHPPGRMGNLAPPSNFSFFLQFHYKKVRFLAVRAGVRRLLVGMVGTYRRAGDDSIILYNSIITIGHHLYLLGLKLSPTSFTHLVCNNAVLLSLGALFISRFLRWVCSTHALWYTSLIWR